MTQPNIFIVALHITACVVVPITCCLDKYHNITTLDPVGTLILHLCLWHRHTIFFFFFCCCFCSFTTPRWPWHFWCHRLYIGFLTMVPHLHSPSRLLKTGKKGLMHGFLGRRQFLQGCHMLPSDDLVTSFSLLLQSAYLWWLSSWK